MEDLLIKSYQEIAHNLEKCFSTDRVKMEFGTIEIVHIFIVAQKTQVTHCEVFIAEVYPDCPKKYSKKRTELCPKRVDQQNIVYSKRRTGPCPKRGDPQNIILL